MAKGKRMEQANQTHLNRSRRKIFMILCLALFLYSSYQLILWLTSNISMQRQMSELIQDVVKEEETASGETTKKIDFEKIRQINQDVVAWIEIPNTNIDYPVFQAKDNAFYLTKDMYKKYNTAGSVFLDYKNNTDFHDDNSVIYGHNLRSGKMFADLQKIVTGALQNEITIYVYQENENRHYRVFSSYIAEPVKEPIMTTLKDKKAFIEQAIEKSEVNFNILPDEQDNLLTLSTCDNKGKRIIVHSVQTKLIEEGR